jgi:hypothetical protein
MVLPQNPICDCHQTLAEQRNVEAQFRGSQIHGLFLFGKQIDQDGADRAFVKHVSHMPVSGASATAAAPMGENDKSFGVNRQSDIGSEFDAIDGHFYGNGFHFRTSRPHEFNSST